MPEVGALSKSGAPQKFSAHTRCMGGRKMRGMDMFPQRSEYQAPSLAREVEISLFR